MKAVGIRLAWIRRAGCILAAAGLVGGCATKGDVRELQTSVVAELNDISARQDTLLREIATLRVALLDTVALLERRGVSGRVELERRLQQLNEDLARLMALVGQSQRSLVELQRTTPGAPGGGAAVPPEEGGAAAGDTPAADAGGGGDPQALYEASLRQFRRGSFETARAGFEEFLERYPGHELAPDALFYVAETWAAEGDQQEALTQFGRILELHPASRRAPAALYRMGEIALERGEEETAREHFTRILQTYPDSDEAALAADRLERLDD